MFCKHAQDNNPNTNYTILNNKHIFKNSDKEITINIKNNFLLNFQLLFANIYLLINNSILCIKILFNLI